MTISVQLVQIPPAETLPKREFYMTADSFKIGRDFAADICLPDLSHMISRTHLVVQKTTSGGYCVTDVSANGAKLNDEVLPPKEAKPLSDGDLLSFSGYRMMLGIVKQPGAERPTAAPAPPERKFEAQTDFASTSPLLPDADVQQIANEPERGFSQTEVDLDPDLMFDPFAEGPELREPLRLEQRAGAPASPDDFDIGGRFGESVGLVPMSDRHMPSAAALHDAQMRSAMYRDNMTEAMEQALDRFLSELDPNVLQADYDEFIPRFANHKRRYWSIHCRQFTKKKSKGEFRRSFMALFAEEMRKL